MDQERAGIKYSFIPKEFLKCTMGIFRGQMTLVIAMP